MENKIKGIHHITAIAGNAKRNYHFYTQILGLRLVKKTVNFDDPGTYHFYFGDAVGTPGTILTFFPWDRVRQGTQGSGMATDIGYSVPDKSLGFWTRHFEKHAVPVTATGSRFGEDYLTIEDPDGLPLTLIVPSHPDSREPWETTEVKKEVATRGFHSVTLTLHDVERTARVLTDVLGYAQAGKEGNRYRFTTDAADNAAIVDLLEDPTQAAGVNAGGTIHHIAFRVKDEATQLVFREKVIAHGLHITPKIDRNYFYSLYFREPGGVLFEIATDNPGFLIDESMDHLGTTLKLPPQYEMHRAEIEKVLPPVM